jgi:hypothetical protein
VFDPFIEGGDPLHRVRGELKLAGVGALGGLGDGDLGVWNGPAGQVRGLDDRGVGDLFQRWQLDARISKRRIARSLP